MMDAREIEIELAHLRLAARAFGDPALPKLLALHGWLDNAASFDRLAPLLCEHFHIVALDLPGHGRSAHRPPALWYHYIDYLGDVLAAADALGWQRFGLLGHSLGGAIASMIAGVAGERIERLLLIEALGPMTLPAEQTLTHLQRSLGERGQTGTLRVFASEEEAAQVRVRGNGLLTLSRDAAMALIARGTMAVAGGVSWSSDQRLTLTSPVRYTEEQISSVLSGIRAPTLLVLAEPSPPFLSAEMIQKRSVLVPGIRIVRIPGSHHLHLEDPQPVSAAILQFERERV
jgi:pimeloyl-ACP methyl ester carboxylesterase